MAFLGQTYNVDELPEGRNFDPLPDGWYHARMTEALLSATKDGAGQYIKVRYDITGPTHEGRVVFGNINIRNANPKAEEIGRQNLGDIARAIGLRAISDTDQLIGGDLQIKLTTQKQDGYELKNEVRGFKAIGAAPPAARPSGPSFAAKPAPAASKAPPWKKAAPAPVDDSDIPF